MRRNQQPFVWLGISILGVLTLPSALVGQASRAPGADVPLPTDWSHHHLIFSRPATAERAKRVERDPRYWQQQYRQLAKLPQRHRPLPKKSKTASKGLKRDWSEDLGGSATVGAGNYPAKFSFQSTEVSCTNDFVVYGTGLLGSTGQPSIVAFSNLYSGCGSTVPTVYWAYDTGGTAVTSPVFSSDGKQVAFVQAGDGYPATLVLLKWAASSGTLGSPIPLTAVPHGSYYTCTAPCMTIFALQGPLGTYNNDSGSSVFYDYEDDTAYVGDNSGWLHKFTPFFNRTPAGVGTGGWPVHVSSTALTSPVHDYASGNIFVADNGGYLYSVDSAGGVTQSGELDYSIVNDGGPGIVEGPIVDSTSGLVYVFAPSDGSGGCAGGSDCTGVFQLTTGFTAGSTGSEAVVGSSTTEPTAPSPLYLGAFDSTYEGSVSASGHLYVCGNTGGQPTIYQIAIQGGVLGTVSTGPTVSTSTTPCSPVTDVLNPYVSLGPTEWVFASAEAGGVSSGCSSGGCIFNFNDTPWQPSTVYGVGQEVLDSNLHIEVAVSAGTSSAGAPFWSITTGGTTTDGSVHWRDQGPVSATTPAAWASTHSYTKGTEILDPNENIELVTTAGPSGLTIPTFNSTAGGTTTDGTVTWTNVGAIGTAALPAAGGTSGIIIDNIVGSGTLAGASQVYFSTLSDQTCATSGGSGGCAVQASQSALK